ncbi:MAG: hypothetical protein M1380_07055, partial [Chloroflexi bacterium]|nr:hypothetical protein [Chloroflexota bacterium]
RQGTALTPTLSQRERLLEGCLPGGEGGLGGALTPTLSQRERENQRLSLWERPPEGRVRAVPAAGVRAEPRPGKREN